mmetsp:Transcript_4016/g.4579  ORF Transcript_4016/g.4579 Transcript_4016/m.4579 type:complete len:228 (-) Transcript_4016:141-824(-)
MSLEPSTTAPKGSESLASFTSMPRQAPDIVSSDLWTPANSTTRSSLKGRVRICGRKERLNCALSFARRNISDGGANIIPRCFKVPSDGANETVVASLLLFTILIDLVESCPARSDPKFKLACLGSETVTASGVPSPRMFTFTMIKPLISNLNVRLYVIASLGKNVMGISHDSPGWSTVGAASTSSHVVFSVSRSKLISLTSSFVTFSTVVIFTIPTLYKKHGPKSFS